MKGRPRNPRCSKCARRVLPLDHGDGFDLERTGSAQNRDGVAYLEVRCRDCHHVGWTKHGRAFFLPLGAP
jgi:hypothetical protein